jgi:signal transduction histidine kinase
MSKFSHIIPERLRTMLTSIRLRLTLWFVVILALVLLVFSVFVYILQAQDLRRQTLSRLENQISQIQSVNGFSHLEPFENGVTIPNISTQTSPLLQQEDVLAVVDVKGQVMQKYGPVTNQEVNQLATTGISGGAGQGPFTYSLVSATATNQNTSEEYIFVVAPISIGRTVIGFLILGSPVDPGEQLHRLILTLLFGALIVLVIALAGGYWLADRAMRPVKTITQAAHQISETDLSRRLNLGKQDEIGQLADTFDQMLARLQAAFERQRQFTADASHELRTPLTIVNLEANRALTNRRSTEEYKRALGVIQSENEFMTRLVNNLLTLSRMDAGQTVLKTEELDLSDIALEVIERVAPIASRNEVELSVGDLPELKISGDRQYLSQMITNLVENAIKYTKGPEGRVRVETGWDQNQSNAMGWVRVKDNGPGIPAESQPYLFDRFYQVDKARSGNHEHPQEGEISSGIGLGLSIVQWIASAHGGEVKVESQVGQGSIFTVRIPLLEIPTPTP